MFDPDRIAERATYDDPHQYAAGISTVIVNGEVVIDGGDHTGALPGRVLRRESAGEAGQARRQAISRPGESSPAGRRTS